MSTISMWKWREKNSLEIDGKYYESTDGEYWGACVRSLHNVYCTSIRAWIIRNVFGGSGVPQFPHRGAEVEAVWEEKAPVIGAPAPAYTVAALSNPLAIMRLCIRAVYLFCFPLSSGLRPARRPPGIPCSFLFSNFICFLWSEVLINVAHIRATPEITPAFSANKIHQAVSDSSTGCVIWRSRWVFVTEPSRRQTSGGTEKDVMCPPNCKNGSEVLASSH